MQTTEAQVAALYARGEALLAEQAFDEALLIADQLEALRTSAAFEIASRAHLGSGDVTAAITVLERGVSLVPQAWPLWLVLGNCRSDLERYEAAEAAYDAADRCADTRVDLVRLNRAVLAERRGRFEEAQRLAAAISEPGLRLGALDVRARVLLRLGRFDEVLALAAEARDLDGDDDEDARARLEASAARAQAGRGEGPSVVRGRIFEAIAAIDPHPALLDALRELTGRLVKGASRYRVVVGCRDEDGGFYRGGQVIAESPEEAAACVAEVERLQVGAAEVELLEAGLEEERIGVVWLGPRMYFPEGEG